MFSGEMISSRIWPGREAGTAEKERCLEKTVSDVFVLLRDPVYRYLLGITGNPGDAEDLTQETFIRLYQCLRDGEKVHNVRSWIFRVAHNLGIDLSRRPERARTAEWDSDRRAEPAGPGVSAEAAAIRRQTLEAALGSLSPQERRCVELRAEGLCYREIGEVLGIRIPTVQTAVNRAVKKLAGLSHE
jgi:RNA polymerase sigma-70 factor, ECF subfamily